jgi:hypothetical protein
VLLHHVCCDVALATPPKEAGRFVNNIVDLTAFQTAAVAFSMFSMSLRQQPH